MNVTYLGSLVGSTVKEVGIVIVYAVGKRRALEIESFRS